MALCAPDPPVLDIKQGSSAVLSMVYTEPPVLPLEVPPLDLVPIDLTDYGIYMDFINNKTGQILIATSNKELIPAVYETQMVNEVPTEVEISPSVYNGITVTDAAAGEYIVDAGPTELWPIGKMDVDIKYTSGEITQHTDTFVIDLARSITK